MNEQNGFTKSICCFIVVISLCFTPLISSEQTNTIHLIDPPISLGDTIIIPDDFPTVQEGIDHAQPGDNIFVRKGVYTEQITVNKKELTISGECNKNTIIDVQYTENDAITIIADDVLIENLNIFNARTKNDIIWDQSGIDIHSSNSTIRNNIFHDNRLGINVHTSAYNLTIIDNQFFNDGILIGNYLKTGDMLLQSMLHTIENNTVNGKPLYYIKNTNNAIVPSDAGQIILVNCSNMTVKDTIITETDFSIIVAYCTDSVIENCTIENTYGELILFCSMNNTIQYNTIKGNLHGICLDYGSTHNIVRYNDVSKNIVGISIITKTNNNLIYKNTIYQNNLGLSITTYLDGLPSQSNIVKENYLHNNFFGLKIYPSMAAIKTKSFDNTIVQNVFSMNQIALQLTESTETTIENNSFTFNLISSTFINASDTTWNNNYWGRPRKFPKIIPGMRYVGTIPVPWINIDRNPAKKPPPTIAPLSISYKDGIIPEGDTYFFMR